MTAVTELPASAASHPLEAPTISDRATDLPTSVLDCVQSLDSTLQAHRSSDNQDSASSLGRTTVACDDNEQPWLSAIDEVAPSDNSEALSALERLNCFDPDVFFTYKVGNDVVVMKHNRKRPLRFAENRKKAKVSRESLARYSIVPTEPATLLKSRIGTPIANLADERLRYFDSAYHHPALIRYHHLPYFGRTPEQRAPSFGPVQTPATSVFQHHFPLMTSGNFARAPGTALGIAPNFLHKYPIGWNQRPVRFDRIYSTSHVTAWPPVQIPVAQILNGSGQAYAPRSFGTGWSNSAEQLSLPQTNVPSLNSSGYFHQTGWSQTPCRPYALPGMLSSPPQRARADNRAKVGVVQPVRRNDPHACAVSLGGSVTARHQTLLSDCPIRAEGERLGSHENVLNTRSAEPGCISSNSLNHARPVNSDIAIACKAAAVAGSSNGQWHEEPEKRQATSPQTCISQNAISKEESSQKVANESAARHRFSDEGGRRPSDLPASAVTCAATDNDSPSTKPDAEIGELQGAQSSKAQSFGGRPSPRTDGARTDVHTLHEKSDALHCDHPQRHVNPIDDVTIPFVPDLQKYSRDSETTDEPSTALYSNQQRPSVISESDDIDDRLERIRLEVQELLCGAFPKPRKRKSKSIRSGVDMKSSKTQTKESAVMHVCAKSRDDPTEVMRSVSSRTTRRLNQERLQSQPVRSCSVFLSDIFAFESTLEHVTVRKRNR